MSNLNPEQLTVSELLLRAMPAHAGAEQAIKLLIARIHDTNNGQVIHLPGQPPRQLQGPQQIEILATLTQAFQIILQTNRLMMVALEAIDERLQRRPKH